MPVTGFRTLFGVDLRTLALVRVGLGLLVIADLLVRSRTFSAHYTDAGAAPREALLVVRNFMPASLHMISGSAWVTAVLFVAAGLFAVALAIGYRSRIAAFLCWIFLLSLDARNPWVSQGGDMLLRMLMFWMIFLPIGARFSVDAAMDKMSHGENQHFSVASTGLLLQVVCVYFFTALLKSDPVWIPDGTAVYYALANDTLVTPIGEWLRQFPGLMSGLTYFVWFLEIATPVLVFSPVFHVPIRLLALVLLIGMHIGFLACLSIGLFPFVSIVSLLCLTPAVVWDWLDDRLQTPERRAIRIYYDAGCTFCEKTCRLLRTFLVLPQARIATAQDDPDAGPLLEAHNSWVVYAADGGYRLRWAAVAWLVRQSPLWGWLGYLLSLGWLARLGDRFYQWVAENRSRLGELTAVFLPFRSVATQNTLIGNAVCSVLVVVLIWVNLASLRTIDVRLPGPVAAISASVRLGQKWTMFAPSPAQRSGWFVARGQTADGEAADVYLGVLGEPRESRESREAYLDANYARYRWRKYLSRLPLEERVELRPYYVQYLCRRWDSRHPDAPLQSLRLYFVAERTQPPPQPREQERHLSWQSECGVDPTAQVMDFRRGIMPTIETS